MPRPPAHLDWEINFLTEWWTVPCAVPLMVYFQTLHHAIGTTVATLLMFDLNDVVRGYFRPVPNRRWRHGRKARKGRFKKALIPETGEIVAKWIPGAEEVPGRWVDDGVRFLWEVDAFLQKLFYFIMIFDVIDDFWTDLNTGIITDERANCGDSPRLKREGHPEISGPQGWTVMDLDHVVYAVGIDLHDPFGAQVGPGQWMVIFSATIYNKSPFSDDLTCGCRVQATFNGQTAYDNGSVKTIARGELHNSIAQLKFNGPGFCAWEGLVVNGEADFRNARAFVFKIGDPQT